ncbi:MAG: TPD domain-containing protein [Euryarchaeota archaeon]|nr:TPD domain-containing protein [Euryarchaeota archaeon]
MKYEVYKKIYKKLNSTDDVNSLMKEFNVERDLLLSLLSQKIVRKVKRRYYKIKKKRKILRKKWDRGKSIMEIAEEYEFAPVLTASFVFQDIFSKKKFKENLKEPDKIKNKRIKREIKKVVEKDIVYSPKFIELQTKSGVSCEERTKNWLIKKNIKFITEEGAREENFRKTPDFLLTTPFSLNGLEVRWVESKAGFGDLIKFKEDFKGQLNPYVRLFGSGLIVYWAGHLDRLTSFSDRVLVCSKEFFEDGEKV